MKNSKMLLTGIAVLGIVGTSLAFTAKPNSVQFCVRPHVAPASALCTAQTPGTLDATGTLYYGVQKGTAACTATTCNANLTIIPAE